MLAADYKRNMVHAILDLSQRDRNAMYIHKEYLIKYVRNIYII